MYILILVCLLSIIKSQTTSPFIPRFIIKGQIELKEEVKNKDNKCECAQEGGSCGKDCFFLLRVQLEGNQVSYYNETTFRDLEQVELSVSAPITAKTIRKRVTVFGVRSGYEIDHVEFPDNNFFPNDRFYSPTSKYSKATFKLIASWNCPHNFGDNCLSRCSAKSVHAVCDPVTGLTSCEEGFILPPACESVFCNPNPCQSQGICVGSISGYTCNCLPGFSGRNCEN